MQNEDPLWQLLAHRKARALTSHGSRRSVWPLCDPSQTVSRNPDPQAAAQPHSAVVFSLDSVSTRRLRPR